MKRLLLAVVLATSAMPAFAADVGLSLSIGQPGFYGRIDIGDYPPPQIIYRQPRLMYRQPVLRPPIYLHVPPSHSKNWRYHCRQYGACGERVYFVRGDWYEREYVPYYRERHGDRRDEHRGDRRDEHRDDDRHDRRGHDRHR